MYLRLPVALPDFKASQCKDVKMTRQKFFSFLALKIRRFKKFKFFVNLLSNKLKLADFYLKTSYPKVVHPFPFLVSLASNNFTSFITGLQMKGKGMKS